MVGTVSDPYHRAVHQTDVLEEIGKIAVARLGRGVTDGSDVTIYDVDTALGVMTQEQKIVTGQADHWLRLFRIVLRQTPNAIDLIPKYRRAAS